MNDKPYKDRYFSGRVIFDHLPKTAGQAVNAWLVSQLGCGCVSSNLIGVQREIIHQYGGIFPIISGHIHFDGDELNPLYLYLTCLREPLDRAISYIFFVIKNHTASQLGFHFEDVSRFIESDGIDLSNNLEGYLSNPYVSHFVQAGDSVALSEDTRLRKAMDVIQQYDVVGLYEEMPKFLASIAGLLGLSAPSPLPKVNVTKARPTIDQISPGLRQRLLKLNLLDLELYQWLRSHLKQKQAASKVILPAISNWIPYNQIDFLGSDNRLNTKCGRRDGTRLISNGKAGFLLHGPYIGLTAGQYKACLSLSYNSILTGAWMDVVSSGGKNCWAKLDLQQFPGGSAVFVAFELTEVCSDLEVRLWVPAGTDAAVNSLRIEPIVQPVVKYRSSEDARVAMTISCKDCGAIPKVANAGAVFSVGGQIVQLMHNGTRVVAGGYFGEWMQTVIQQLQGHHEPQEELLFHTLLKHARPGSLMVELGCFWAYYSNWYLGAVPLSKAMCIEPDEARMRVGQQNIMLNQRTATFHLAAAGGQFYAEQAFVRESDGATVMVPVWDFAKLLEQVGADPIELLHMDTQGAELPFLQSIARTAYQGRLRFVVVSTHHASISGSATTHRDCLATLINMGAFILCEHAVDESFSGDGLIVASFHAADAGITMPLISRNQPENSLFGPDPSRAVRAAPVLADDSALALPLHALADLVQPVQTADGSMHIFAADAVIGASLKNHGSFQTDKIDEVLAYLRTYYAFTPELFVDVGANIGTHLVHALTACGFAQGLAFEPDPHNFALLVQNMATNNLQAKARAFKLALSAHSGASTFELCDTNFGDHRVRQPGLVAAPDLGESQRRVISVLTDTADTFFAENSLALSTKTLVWVDTQGHEGHVFKGMDQALAGLDKPFIVCEFWPYGLERAGGKDLMFDFLNRCAVIYDINQPGWQNNPLAGTLPLQKLYRTMLDDTRLGHYPHTDLLCVL